MRLNEIRRKRQDWVKANRENNFEEGIKNLLTELYPDNAHFIYELLQNAEDPGASSVMFTLNDDSLEFEHNATRLFDINDVESITSIGTSTKRNDETSIGKFGVGFKAVFAYTSSPEIHSGQFHFRITDMVIPELIAEQESPAVKINKTRFIFPFNHPKKTKEQANTEVEKALRALDDNTLLFLTNIDAIEYMLPSGEIGSLRRIQKADNEIIVRSILPDGTERSSYWLRYQKDVVIADDDGKDKHCRIAIAYLLSKTENKKSIKWEVEPLEPGRVSIFFPAEKETSNLKFHVHAPFASTVARDSVRDSDANNQLRDELADLVVDSLHAIKERGLLTVKFLSVLPIPQDNLSPFYERIRARIVEAFRAEDLTPTKSGGHKPSTSLYRGPAKISDVLDDDDLSFLTGYETPLWAGNSLQNQRADKFLDTLEIDQWSWDELGEKFDGTDEWWESETEVESDTIEHWLKVKKDEWLRSFYSLLGEASHYQFHSFDWSCLNGIRTDDGNHGDFHTSPKNVFFPPNEDTPPPAGKFFIKRSILDDARPGAQRENIKRFLEHVGVKELNEEALIEQRIEEYKKGNVKADKHHFSDIAGFVRAFEKNRSIIHLLEPGDPDLPPWRPSNGAPFLLKEHHRPLTNVEGYQQFLWRSPAKLFMDSPYLQSGLSDHADIHHKSALSGIYLEKLPKKLHKGFIEFLKALGVQHSLSIIKVSIRDNPNADELRRHGCRVTVYGVNDDYIISNLEEYIETKSISASWMIWNALTGAAPEAAKARYSPNGSYPPREAPSQLVHQLKSTAWIPDKSGVFLKPSDITKDDLREDFIYDNRNGLLTAIDFGRNHEIRSEQHREKEQAAKIAGFDSVEEAETAKEIAALLRERGLTLTQFIEMIPPRTSPELPEKSVADSARRRSGVLEITNDAAIRESVTRERAVIPGTSEEVARAKAYLRGLYTNIDEKMVCQCCRSEMPFKVHETHYFEAVKLLKKQQKHVHQARLALCPTCAAMYKYARDTPDTELKEALLAPDFNDASPSREVQVALASRPYRLWFTGTHCFDIRTVLLSETSGDGA